MTFDELDDFLYDAAKKVADMYDDRDGLPLSQEERKELQNKLEDFFYERE